MLKGYKTSILLFSALALTSAGSGYGEDWGTWDDLPSDLLSPNSSRYNIDRLYEQLRSNVPLPSDFESEIDDWLMSMNIEFENNAELSELLDELAGEDPEDIAEEIEDWLEDQLDAYEDALEDQEDELEELQELEDEAEDSDIDDVEEDD